jgi:subtilisin family serine protease
MSEIDRYEYIVTLNNREDLPNFYDDMETPGGDLYIPDRAVGVASKRHISRNTHYYLTEQEADLLKNDPRVLAVSRLPRDLGMEPISHWQQTGKFEKSTAVQSTAKNWGLARIVNGVQTDNWGNNGLFNELETSITTDSAGEHVDVVIVDAHINPDHPEFAVNEDGTGGTRVIQYDWFQHQADVGLSGLGSYSYGDFSSNHGTHVAGTMAGNTQGWARKSNIYYMEFNYAGWSQPQAWALYLFDFIRAWHNSKPINPVTGRRNPTVTNNSWGYSFGNIFLSDITSVTYRGATTNLTGLTTAAKKIQLENNGVPVPASTYLFRTPARVSALDADIADAIEDGIIVVASAGNSYWNVTNDPTHPDYDNSVDTDGGVLYHSNGSSPGAAAGAICVGALSTVTQEYKTNFSNYGDRIDIWAPGQNIISSVFNSTASSEFGIALADDPRNPVFKIGSISGTSMSGPQVAGVIACMMSRYPNYTPQELYNYLIVNAKTGQIGTTNGNYGDYTNIRDSVNKYLYFPIERAQQGKVYPDVSYDLRPTTGKIYPRLRIRRRG